MSKPRKTTKGKLGLSFLLGLPVSLFILPIFVIPDNFLSEGWWQVWSFFIFFLGIPIAYPISVFIIYKITKLFD